MKKKKLKPCDCCQKEFSIHKLKKFRKKQLMKAKGFIIKNEIYLDEKLKILETTNPNFNRKSRLCENCRKDLDFSESIYKQEE